MEYWPAEQFWQVDSAVCAVPEEYLPGTHARQLVSEVLLARLEYLPLPQDWQDDAPWVEEYFPGMQSRQMVDPGNEENFPGIHEKQLASEVLPFMAECFPAAQFIQSFGLMEFEVLYLPRAQLIHTFG